MATVEPAGIDEQQRAAFMSALVTEHFALQSAASTTVSESAGRASLYLSALTSSLVAAGFAAASPRMFVPFAATVIPVVLLLGVFSTVRLVDTGVQNLQYLAGIARIRAYYRELDPRWAHLFTAWGRRGTDRTGEALASLGLRRSPLVGLFTTASMIAAINSIVAGAGTVLACAVLLGRDRRTSTRPRTPRCARSATPPGGCTACGLPARSCTRAASRAPCAGRPRTPRGSERWSSPRRRNSSRLRWARRPAIRCG